MPCPQTVNQEKEVEADITRLLLIATLLRLSVPSRCHIVPGILATLVSLLVSFWDSTTNHWLADG